MARAQGSRAQMGMAFESTYGTAPVSGFKRMAFASPTDLGTEQPLLANELLGYGRDPLAPSKDAITSDGSITVPVDSDGIGYWLKGLLGAPTTTGTTPKTHTFTSGGLSVPSMSIEMQMPEVPLFEMFSGVCVDSMKFSLARSGLLQATAKVIAQGSSTAGTTQAGALTDITLQRFGHFNGAIKRDGATLANITEGEFTYSNNLDPIGTIRSDGKIDGLDLGVAALTGSITTRFADTTLYDQAIAGTPCSLEFSWTISASVSLTITAHAVYLPRPRRKIDGPGGISAAFDWQAAKAASPARMMTAVLVNAVTAY